MNLVNDTISNLSSEHSDAYRAKLTEMISTIVEHHRKLIILGTKISDKEFKEIRELYEKVQRQSILNSETPANKIIQKIEKLAYNKY